MGSVSSNLHCVTKSPFSNTEIRKKDEVNDVAKNSHQLSSLSSPQQVYLNEKQASILMMMNMEAVKLSAIGERELLKRLPEDKLRIIAKYVQYQSEIVIHFFLDKLIEDFLEDEDGRYKNLFEIGKGNGSNCQITRARWEDRLFFNGYMNAEAHERVKYGCLNLGDSVNGVASAFQVATSIRTHMYIYIII